MVLMLSFFLTHLTSLDRLLLFDKLIYSSSDAPGLQLLAMAEDDNGDEEPG
uniref:Uncharacterized protein n=1 Tax=Helianthus annuus TaxID=4232 RepID=A0A251S0T2_HELAN